MKHVLTKYKPVFFHLIGWSLFFIVQFSFSNSFPIRMDYEFMLLISLLLLVLFYTNYFLLVPWLLFKNRKTGYVISVILLLAILYTINVGIHKRIGERFKNSFPGVENRKDIFKNKPDFHPGNFRPEEGNRTYFYGKPEHFDKPGPLPPPFFDNPHNRAAKSFIPLLLLSIITGTVIKLMQKWKELENAKNESQEKHRAAELANLKQQINPHFLFNSLNSIFSLANRQSEETPKAVLTLSEILRYNLYDTEKAFILLEKEIVNIQNYVSLQKLRLTDKTEVMLEFSGDPQKNVIEPLILLTFVENAFKYGSDNYNKSFIGISISIVQNILHFSCKNHVINQSNNHTETESSGIGLENVIRRLELLYPDSHLLETGEDNGIFSVELTINLKNEMHSD